MRATEAIGGNAPSLGQLAQPAPVPIDPPATPEARNSLRDKIVTFLRQPEVRAGLLQFATNVLQPIGPQQSPLGAVAKAAGAGLQAAGRVEANAGAKRANAEAAALERRKAATAEQRVRVAEQGVEAQQADTVARQDIAAKQIDAEAKSLGKRLAAELKIAATSADAALLVALVKGELARRKAADADVALGGTVPTRPPLADVVRQQFLAVQGKAPAIAIQNFSDADIQKVIAIAGDPNDPRQAAAAAELAKVPSDRLARLRAESAAAPSAETPPGSAQGIGTAPNALRSDIADFKITAPNLSDPESFPSAKADEEAFKAFLAARGLAALSAEDFRAFGRDRRKVRLAREVFGAEVFDAAMAAALKKEESVDPFAAGF